MRYPFVFLTALTAVSLFALPSGHKATHGKVEVTASGKELHIKSGKHAVIHWDQFSIGKGERAHFQMKNSKSSVLNRITGGERSDIFGKLESNGNIYLLNSKGILIGPDAQINVNALVASTLDVLDEGFLRDGEIRFFGDEKGSIINMGKIEGNTVYLLASNIENHGRIKAEHVGLATGSKILLRPEGEQRIFIEASNAEESIDNRGKIEALTTEIKNNSPYVLAVRTSGSVEANGVEKRDGKIFLVADKGTLEVDGLLQASHIEASGKEVYLFDKAHVEAPEGQVFIGGDPQSLTEGMVASDLTVLYADAIINTSAGDKGHAGDVYIYSDKLAAHYGKIYARGGPNGGDGGFVELSGKEHLGFEGVVDCGADAGKPGTLYLDPKFADIGGGATPLPATSWTFASSPAGTFSIPAPLGAGSVSTALNTSAVVIECNTDCTFSGAVAPSAGSNPLTVNTGRSCIFTGTGSVTLLGATGVMTIKINDENAIGANRDAGLAIFSMASGSSITTAGGNITQDVGFFGGVQEATVFLGTVALSAAGGNISLLGPGSASVSAVGISTLSSTVSTTGTGTINLQGTGGFGASSNIGLRLDSSSFTAVDGLISMVGVGRGDGSTNGSHGINLLNGTLIDSTGTSASTSGIDLSGTGGAGPDQNSGIFTSGGGNLIQTVTGDVVLKGVTIVGGTGFDNRGIYFSDGSQIKSNGTGANAGNVTLTGTATGGTSGSMGITFEMSSTIESTDGNISLTGTAGPLASSSSNIGVRIDASSIQASGTGAVDITGNAGGGTDDCSGVAVINGGTVATDSGAITITGNQGVATGSACEGVEITGGSGISNAAASAGTMTIIGQGTDSGSDFCEGVVIDSAAISVAGGSLIVTGMGGDTVAAPNSNNTGVRISGTSKVIADASVPMTITGMGGAGTTQNHGVFIDGSSEVRGFDGKITIDGTGMGSTNDNEGVRISSGSVVSVGGVLTLGSGEIEITGQGAAGTSDNRGISVNSSTITSGVGDVTLTGTGGAGSADDNQGIAFFSSALTSTDGDVLLDGTGGSGTNENTGTGIGSSAAIIVDNGSLRILGTSIGTTENNQGVGIGSGSLISSTGTAPITIVGTANPTGTDNNIGVTVDSAGTTITSSSAKIDIRGTGGGTGTGPFAAGAAFAFGGTVAGTGSAEVEVNGFGGDSTMGGAGVILLDEGTISTVSGLLTVNGTGGVPTTLSHGVVGTSFGGAGGRITSESGIMNITGMAAATGDLGMRFELGAMIDSTLSSPMNITTLSDLFLTTGGQIIGGSSPVVIDVDRDFIITGDAPGTGVLLTTGSLRCTVGRDLTVTAGIDGFAIIGSATPFTTANITFPSIGRNLLVDAVANGSVFPLGTAVIGHGFSTAVGTFTGNITFSNINGSVTVQGANLGVAGSGGVGQIGHYPVGGAAVLNGDITMSRVGGSISVIGGTAAGFPFARIGHGGAIGVITTTASSEMLLVAGNNITLTTPSVAPAIITNPSTTGRLRLVVDNSFPTMPGFGAGSFTLGADSLLNTGGGELRIYTVRPSQNTVNELINGAPFTPTPFNVDDDNNQYNVYFAGGTFVPGAVFRVYYKVGSDVVNEIVTPFVDTSLFLLQVAEAQAELEMPLFRYMRLPNYPWHHPSICGSRTACDPGFDPYHSFIFEDNVYWVGESSEEAI